MALTPGWENSGEPTALAVRTVEFRRGQAVKSLGRHRLVGRATVIAVILAAGLGYAGSVVSVAAPGYALITVAVSIEGAADSWAPVPTQTNAAAPATTTETVSETATTSPTPIPTLIPTSDQPSTPATSETTSASPTGTTPVDEQLSSSGPEPTTR